MVKLSNRTIEDWLARLGPVTSVATMRDQEIIDSELRLLAAVRWSIRERGGEPSSRQADELLDERNELTAGQRPSDRVSTTDFINRLNWLFLPDSVTHHTHGRLVSTRLSMPGTAASGFPAARDGR